MSDIKLFRISSDSVSQLNATSVSIEKTLQSEIEAHLETFLGVTFLASEYNTGKTHGGRIDTLGLDENGCPVIIEYKRSINQNVINQGLYYLDWLLDHKGEFELLVLKKCGQEASDKIEWTSPRLVCIAGDFTKYDQHAVQQINRNIELLRYCKFGDDLLLLELVNAVTADSEPTTSVSSVSEQQNYKTASEYLEQASSELANLYDATKELLLSLGDDVQEKVLKYYFAFKRIKNFACVEVRPSAKVVLVYAKVDPESITLEDGFTRDVRNIGHYGTGGLEITIRSIDDLHKARHLLEKSYELS